MELPQNNNWQTSNDQRSQQPVQRPPRQSGQLPQQPSMHPQQPGMSLEEPGQFPQYPDMFPQQPGVLPQQQPSAFFQRYSQPGMYQQQPGMQQNQMMNPQMMHQQQQMMPAKQQRGKQLGYQQLKEIEIVSLNREGQQPQHQQMNEQQQKYQQEQQKQQFQNDELLPPEGYKTPRYSRQELPVYCDENALLTDSYQRFLYNIGDFCGAGKAILPCCCVNYPYLQIDQGFVAIHERFGKYVRTEQPGLVYFNPCTDKMYPLDCKLVVIDCNRQFVITMDNIMCSMDATVYFRIVVPRKAFYYLENISQSVQQLAQASIINLAGGRKYQELQSKREELQREIEEFVTRHVWEWGVEIQQIRIKEIILSPELRKALSMVTKKQRQAEAKIITAQSDIVSAKLMREAAYLLDSKAAMQIRWLETLTMLGSQISTKVILVPNKQ